MEWKFIEKRKFLVRKDYIHLSMNILREKVKTPAWNVAIFVSHNLHEYILCV